MADYGGDYVPGSEDGRSWIRETDPLANTDEMYYTTRLTPREVPFGFHIGNEPIAPPFFPGEEPESLHNMLSTGDRAPTYHIPDVDNENHPWSGLATGVPDSDMSDYHRTHAKFGATGVVGEVAHEAALAGVVSAAAIFGLKVFGTVGAVIGAGLGALIAPKVFK